MSSRNRLEAEPPRHALWTLLSPYVWLQFLRQTWLNIKAAKTHYFLGFAACWLVVMVVAVLVSLLAQTPIIFLRLAETSKSEIDIRIDAGDFTGFETLNYTRIKTMLTDPSEQFHSPRLRLSRLWMSPPKSCTFPDQKNNSWLYQSLTDTSCTIGCPTANCPGSSYTWVRRKDYFAKTPLIFTPKLLEFNLNLT